MRCLLLLALLLNLTPTSLSANNFNHSLLTATHTHNNGAYTRKAFLALNKQPFESQNSKRKLLIIGDSHAQDFLNGILENHYLSQYQIRTHYIPTRCQIAFKRSAKPYLAPQDQVFCEHANELEWAKQQVADAQVIIVVARWRDWSAQLLPKTLKQLTIKPNQQVMVLGTRDFGKVTLKQYMHLPIHELKTLSNKVDPVPIATNEPLRKGAEHYIFIDQQSLICGSLKTCRLFTNKGELISYDGGHLTPAGAKWIGQRLFQDSALSQLLTQKSFILTQQPDLTLLFSSIHFKHHF